MQIHLAVILLLVVCLGPTSAFFGGKKKETEKEEPKISGKDSAVLGMMGLREMAAELDMNKLMELQEAMKDPETAREVKKLMEDPEFKREMDKITNGRCVLSRILPLLTL